MVIPAIQTKYDIRRQKNNKKKQKAELFHMPCNQQASLTLQRWTIQICFYGISAWICNMEAEDLSKAYLRYLNTFENHQRLCGIKL